MTTGRLVPDEWRLLLSALCAGSPAWIGTLGTPDTFQLVEPTNFSWLRRLRWAAPATPDDTGVALLELAEPETVPAGAWAELCGELDTSAPPTLEGRLQFGRFDVPGTGRSAVLVLVTAWDDDPAAALVKTVRVRTDPD